MLNCTLAVSYTHLDVYKRQADTLYEVPLLLQKEGLDEIVCRKLGLDRPAADMTHWAAMVSDIKNASREVTIALVGKYVKLHDAYLLSLIHISAALTPH